MHGQTRACIRVFSHRAPKGGHINAGTRTLPLPHLEVYVPVGIPAPTNFVGIGIKVIRGIRVVL